MGFDSKKIYAVLASLFAFFLLATVSQAQEPPAEKAEEKTESKDPDTIKPGVIASFGSKSVVNLNQVDNAPGETASPVIGSVSRSGGSRCTSSIRNSSKESSYSVSYDIVGTNTAGTVAMRQAFSATVKPGGTVSRDLTCPPGLDMQVVLKSGRKLK